MANWIDKIFGFFKRNKYHFIGWAIFITYEVSIIGILEGKFSEFGDYVIHYILNILLFYTHALIILPRALNQYKSIIILFLLLISEFIAYILISFTAVPIIASFLDIHLKTPPKFEWEYLVSKVWRIIYLAMFSCTYYFFRRLKSENMRNLELERARFTSIIERKNSEYELIKSNYTYLRAQINPHFLFNLLKFLQDKAKEILVRSGDAIHVLSRMMRYSLEMTGKEEFVSVSDELEQVKNLIYLNQLRFDNKLQIDLSCAKEALDFKIIPLVLLTLVENMFKHGNLTSPGKRAFIHIYIENNIFHVTTINALAMKIKDMIKYRAGLNNVEKRLALAYNSAASLKCVVNNDNYFSAHISIPTLFLVNQAKIENEEESYKDSESIFSDNKNKSNLTNSILNFLKTNRYHFLGWSIFIAYEVCMVAFLIRKFGDIKTYTLYYILTISLFYIHALIILPYTLAQRRNNILLLVFMIILECIVYVGIALMAIPLILRLSDVEIGMVREFDIKVYLQVTWRFLYLVGFSWTYYLFRGFNLKNRQNLELEQARFQEVIKKKDIEQEVIRSNYAYLRAQINPHFLFNVLNFLYDETKKSSKEVSEAIMTLSEMMQYSLGGLQQEFVVISEEIEQVEHLIYLHQLQLDYTLQIDFNYSDEVVHLEIVPLVLLTLVENIFKHGNLTAPDKRASINLYIENNVFHIVTVNHLRTGEFGFRHSTGLDNIRKRLAFTYNGTENVEFSEDEHHRFVARIEIPVLSLMNPKRISIKA